MKSDFSNLVNKTCIVTGGAGFIGSHLCACLFDLGINVISIDIEANQKSTFFNFLNENRDIHFIATDLSDSSSIHKLAEIKPNIIFHLAGKPYAPFTSVQPNSAYFANVVSTANMLELARIASVDRFLLASSACIFGATSDSPISVKGKYCKPEHYYTYTKREAESLASSYYEFYNIPISICRFVNIYGPGDRHFGRLIPQLCYQLVNNESNELRLLRSSGESVFEFLYVEDAVSGLLSVASKEDSSYSIRHFGTGQLGRMKTKDIANHLSLIYDNKKRKIFTRQTGGEKIVHKYLDINDTKKDIGWMPQWSINDGLSKTVAWYRRYINKIKPFEKDLVIS